MGESERSAKGSSSIACLSASDVSAPATPSSVFVWVVLPSHRTTGVCLRPLVIDEEDAESLIEDIADVAITVSLWSGEAGRLRGASDDERGASKDERGVERSKSSFDLIGERVSDELAMPSTGATDTKIHFYLVLEGLLMSQQPPSLPSVLRPEPAVRDSKHYNERTFS